MFKRIVLFILISMLCGMLVGCGINNDTSPADYVVEPDNGASHNGAVEPEPQPEMDKETSHIMIMNILTNSFDGIGKITYNEEYEVYLIEPTDPAFIESMIYISEGLPAYVAEWESLVSNMQGLSSSISDLIPEASVAIVNPANPENILLHIWQGIVIYDFTDDE